MAPDPSERRDPPPYTKYRARRNPFSRGGGDGLPAVGSAPGDRAGAGPPSPGGSPPSDVGGDPDRPYTLHSSAEGSGGGRPRRRLRLPARRPSAGKVVLRVVQLAVSWVVLSGALFLVSAFVHRDDVSDGLSSSGFPPLSPSTILVLGSDQREKGSKEPGASTSGPSRADSILLMRVGGGHSARLSIPRDTIAAIPGHGSQKINAAFAFGGASLMAETIRQDFGISVDHVVEVSFSNFPDLIDAMGGVDYTGGCVVSRISGGFKNGGYTLRLKAGTTRIHGKQALALARTRHNDCNKRETDLTRARRQQKLFSSMKSRLVSPGAFLRLPFISWAAPKSLKSDMGGPTLLGLFSSLATSGTPKTRVLRPTGAAKLPDGEDGLVVSAAARAAAAARFERE